MALPRKIFAACLLIGVALTSGSLASNDAKITALPDAHDVRNIILGFHGLNIDTYAPITEAAILTSGCVYATEPGSDKNEALMKILQHGIQVSDRGSFRFRLRTVVSIQLHDHSSLRLLISDAHNRKPGVYGTVDNESHGTEGYLSSSEALLITLRAWAKNNLRARNPSPFC